ncbi:hypothetical protein [Marinobacter nauticus]|uniref:HK97 gp10 family phage protein n=1 Tax=Marinobacter nauticus TaxID=2743 RepID=A0A1M2V0W9_MARNT|nr:hypothetical protein [Marinobacter nauticus]OJT01231.1 hypothetical protein BEE62_14880 [Marinobacter nauticus]
MSWSRSLDGFADQVEKDLTQRQKEIAVYALQQIIFGSPVDSGTFKGNHRVTVNGVTGEYSLSMQDANGQRTLLEGMQVIGSISQPFGTVTIQNSLPYSEALESGSSQQAPAGVYTVAFNSTVQRFGR